MLLRSTLARYFQVRGPTDNLEGVDECLCGGACALNSHKWYP